jgi:hypothetical protein
MAVTITRENRGVLARGGFRRYVDITETASSQMPRA